MSLDYFYTTPDAIGAGELEIAGAEFNHLSHVMRKQVGDRVMVVDGCGHAYEAKISELSGHTARCTIMVSHKRIHEPSIHLTIAAALLKNPSRFDYLVEKSVELGVQNIVPLLTRRTIPGHGKRERWQKIALGAMKQSQRSVLPGVSEPQPFSEFLRSVSAESLLLIAHESITGPSLRAMITGHSFVIVCIGPEGGFTDEEIAAATEARFVPVSLGERRLRAETAAVVAAAAILP
jgi:16S rRNA (uracil1498-N3)-methyltransferase